MICTRSLLLTLETTSTPIPHPEEYLAQHKVYLPLRGLLFVFTRFGVFMLKFLAKFLPAPSVAPAAPVVDLDTPTYIRLGLKITGTVV